MFVNPMHHLRTYLVKIAPLALLVTLASVAPASAANKPFSLVISPPPPAVVAAGATATITATLHNEATNQQLGSANLTAPSAFHVTSASIVAPSLGTATPTPSCTGAQTGPCVVQLRNLSLPPGQSVTVTMTVQTPACAASSVAWSIQAKQANNFNGAGNNLTLDAATSSTTTTLDGACKLAFVTEPHNVVVNQPITGTAYTPSGPPVTVDVLDSHNNVMTGSTAAVSISLAANPGAATLGGTTMTNASGGVASFSTLTVNQPAVGYALGASSGTLTPATSSTFTAETAMTNCPANTTCTVNAGNASGNSQIVAAAGAAGSLVESVNINNNSMPLNCGGYTSADPNTYAFFSTTDRGKVGTITIDSPQVPLGTLTISQYLAAQDICFGAPFNFTVKGGGMATPGTLPDGTPGYIGLLPNCPVVAGPCHNRAADKAIPDPMSPIGYDIVLVADIPKGLAGDPMWR